MVEREYLVLHGFDEQSFDEELQEHIEIGFIPALHTYHAVAVGDKVKYSIIVWKDIIR